MEVCSPNVLVGGTFLVGLIWRGWVAPVRPLLAAGMDEEGRAEHEDYLGSLLEVEVGGALLHSARCRVDVGQRWCVEV